MKIVVGLGNPGSQYANTWHNMGFAVIDELAGRFGVQKYKRECGALTAHIHIDGGKKIIFAKPQTYMNLSGDSVYELAKKYKADLSDFLVVVDEVDIPRGEVRFREKGSGGTHNGLRNIIDVMGSGDFARVRVGVGRGNPVVPLVSYVLRKLTPDERSEMASAVTAAADEVIKRLKAGL